MSHDVSRRRLLAGAGAAVAVTAIAAPALATPHPDADLLALGREFDLAMAAERLIPPDADDDEINAATERGGVITRAILALPAKTLDGLRIKARAVEWCACEIPGPDYFGDTTDCQLAASIVRDLLSAYQPAA